MEVKSKARILVIVGHWPSKTHPYLVWLFSFLKKEFTNLQLMLFEQPELSYGYELLGKEHTDAILKYALNRQPFTYCPIAHIKTLIAILLHPIQSKLIISECRQNGLTHAQVYGQFLYYHVLLGKNYDLIHINALQTGFHFKAKAWFGNAKVLLSSRGQDFDFFPDKYDTLLAKVDHVHVLGTYLKNKVLAKGIPEDNITIIPPAHVANESLEIIRTLKPLETTHIATAARLTWTKGYRYALQAIAQLIRQNIKIHYHIYGDGEQKVELLYLVKLLNIQDHVTFHGWINEDSLRKELKKSHLYLLLSIEEGFNNSVVLAQSVSLPCIVSDSGGLPENVIHDQTGFVVNAYSYIEAQHAIFRLIRNPELFSLFSKNALERVKNLSIQQQVEKYKAVYNMLLTT